MLIQEGVKLKVTLIDYSQCLRALLIQEGVKRRKKDDTGRIRLRALLIQEGVKLAMSRYVYVAV